MKIPWRRKWQLTPVFLPGKSYGQRSLVGHSPCGLQRVGHGWVTTLSPSRASHAAVVFCSKKVLTRGSSCPPGRTRTGEAESVSVPSGPAPRLICPLQWQAVPSHSLAAEPAAMMLIKIKMLKALGATPTAWGHNQPWGTGICHRWCARVDLSLERGHDGIFLVNWRQEVFLFLGNCAPKCCSAQKRNVKKWDF